MVIYFQDVQLQDILFLVWTECFLELRSFKDEQLIGNKLD